jgi:hypothetical protein
MTENGQDENFRMKEGKEEKTMRLTSTLWSPSSSESHLPSHPNPIYACRYYADSQPASQPAS